MNKYLEKIAKRIRIKKLDPDTGRKTIERIDSIKSKIDKVNNIKQHYEDMKSKKKKRTHR